MSLFKKKPTKTFKGLTQSITIDWDIKSNSGSAFKLLSQIKAKSTDDSVRQFIRGWLSARGEHLVDDLLIDSYPAEEQQLTEMLYEYENN